MNSPFSGGKCRRKKQERYLLSSWGCEKLHRFYVLFLAKLLKVVLVFQKPEGGTQKWMGEDTRSYGAIHSISDRPCV